MKSHAVRILLLLVVLGERALASSFPGEVLMRPQTGVFWQSQGFRLGTAGTLWLPDQESESFDSREAQTPLEQFSYRNSRSPEGRLRVNVETLKGKTNLEAYARRWVKEYSQYGFQILLSKPTRVNDHPTLVYDILPKSKELQLRQIIQIHHGKAVILTCSDEKAKFGEIADDCNQMARNLIWNEKITR